MPISSRIDWYTTMPHLRPRRTTQPTEKSSTCFFGSMASATWIQVNFSNGLPDLP